MRDKIDIYVGRFSLGLFFVTLPLSGMESNVVGFVQFYYVGNSVGQGVGCAWRTIFGISEAVENLVCFLNCLEWLRFL